MLRIDTLLWAAASAVSLLGLLPVLPALDPPVQLLALAALAGGWLCRRRRRYLPNGPATLLTLAGVGLYLLQLNLTDPVRPLLHALVLLLTLRQLTEPSPRHLLQIFVLGLMLLAGSSLLSLSGWFLLLLVLQVSLVTLALVLLTVHAQAPEQPLTGGQARRLLATAALLPAGSLLLMLFFFTVLPRTRVPLWNALNPRGPQLTGFSEQVAPGSATAVADSLNVAFRAETAALPPEERYWRGAVFERFDGRAWRRGGRARPERLVGGREVRQTLFLRPGETRALFALDRPLAIRGLPVRQGPGRTFRPRRGARERRLSYTAVSRVGGRLLPPARFDPEPLLALPAELSPRLRQLAAGWENRVPPRQRLAQLEDFFRRQGLRYATADLPVTTHPVAAFLFESRAGNCEFFASAFAVLLRLRGVPARVVGGYYGGEYNDLGGYYLVRDAMAHAWVEALLPQQGWVRVDPSTLAVNAGDSIPGRRGGGLSWGMRLADGANYLWTRLVVTYDLDRQRNLLRATRDAFRPGPQTLRRLALLAGLLSLPLIGFGLWRLRPAQRSPEQRLWRQLLRRLGEDEHQLPPAAGLKALRRRHDSPQLQAFLDRYAAAIYRDQPLDAQSWRELRHLLRQLPK